MNTWEKKAVVVKGVSFFDGVIDGKDIKSASIFIEEQMDESSGNAKGFRTVEYKGKDIGVVKRIIHLEFPISGDVTFAMKVTKGGQSVHIEDVKPMGRVPGVPTSKAA